MKALVIGGTRFIGAYVVRRLHDAGVETTVFHRGTSRHPVLPDIEHVCDPSAAYPIVSFPERLRRDWDLVVHMVAMGADDAEAAVETFSGRTRRLIVISSCDVYRAYGRLTGIEPGSPEPVPLTEEAPLRSIFFPFRGMEEQLGAYVRDYDKVLVETAVRSANDLDWTILRLPKVYGSEENGDLATIYGFAAAPAWRWTHGHVRNVAAAIATAAVDPRARGSIFNVGEETTPSMGERLARLPARRGPPAEPPSFDYRQALVVDTTKIRAELGYADVVEERSAMIELAAQHLDIS
ncbi:NAD-dependent epimerase/dehydratase family protein [Methylosinus sp. Sm6]|uniref:NAD-dependent epimerase/dehydratase family protein n=1 Tax=Methylosinus sp. Sm6 TaxID=2866948 RepID=UPI001C98FF87|nr:NAD-dependent epimerase/dehydratase family protein [Methylosinus sp. Sm6]MBY6240891.1 NAD-dependent epimerase/dehydratase family protein [Methylosinus sp. Sm6]